MHPLFDPIIFRDCSPEYNLQGVRIVKSIRMEASSHVLGDTNFYEVT